MRLRDALKLKKGDVVHAPRLAIWEGYVTELLPQVDPRIQLLVEVVVPPIGQTRQLNYQLLQPGKKH